MSVPVTDGVDTTTLGADVKNATVEVSVRMTVLGAGVKKTLPSCQNEDHVGTV